MLFSLKHVLKKYFLISRYIWSEIFTKRNFIDFITIPGSLSHIHLKTSKIKDKNVVKLISIITCLAVGVNGHTGPETVSTNGLAVIPVFVFL